MKRLILGMCIMLSAMSASATCVADCTSINSPATNECDPQPITDDCVRLTQGDGGIGVIDIADLGRVAAPVFGVTPSDFAAALDGGCCLVILVGLDGEDVRVTNTDTGQTALFPICN